MNTEDLTIQLNDCLDDLGILIIQNRNHPMQEVLRVHAGFYILQLQEQLDDLDYERALLLCDIGIDIADQYKQDYLSAVREMMEVQA